VAVLGEINEFFGLDSGRDGWIERAAARVRGFRRCGPHGSMPRNSAPR